MKEPLDPLQLTIMADVLDMIDPATDPDVMIDIAMKLARTDAEQAIVLLASLLLVVLQEQPREIQEMILTRLRKNAGNYGT